jgi:mannitol-1-phosphate 5-dehydrogenase
MPTLVQFGAGNIGRSFIAQLFNAAGYKIIFIDVNPDLLKLLNERGCYKVNIVGDRDELFTVSNISAIDGRDIPAVAAAIADADIASTAVGSGALPYIMPALAAGLQKRLEENKGALDIILAENLRGAAGIVSNYLNKLLPADFPLADMAGLVETSIGKMVPLMTPELLAEDPLQLFAEPYNNLIVDEKAFLNPIPAVPGISAKANMSAYVDRKLFIHNLSHAATAYLGFLKNKDYTFIWQAISDPQIKEKVYQVMVQSAAALIAEYPDEFNTEMLNKHINDLLHRYLNKKLGDTIFRVGRDLPRKLSHDDRIIGAMVLCEKHSLPMNEIADIAVAAMKFHAVDDNGKTAPTDDTFHEKLAKEGIEGILKYISGLDINESIAQEILKRTN